MSAAQQKANNKKSRLALTPALFDSDAWRSTYIIPYSMHDHCNTHPWLFQNDILLYHLSEYLSELMFGGENKKCSFCISCLRDFPHMREHLIFSNFQLCEDCVVEYVEKLSVFEKGANVSKINVLYGNRLILRFF